MSSRQSASEPPLARELRMLLSSPASDAEVGAWVKRHRYAVLRALEFAEDDWAPELLEHVAKALCRACSERWRTDPPYVSLNNHWYFKARWVLRAVSHWLPSLTYLRGSGAPTRGNSGEQAANAAGAGPG